MIYDNCKEALSRNELSTIWYYTPFVTRGLFHLNLSFVTRMVVFSCHEGIGH